MFRKKCPRCRKKINKNYDFCPYCGKKLKIKDKEKEERDFGLLGKNDFFDEIDKEIPFFARFPFKKLMQKLARDIEKQMRETDKEIAKESKEIKKIPGGISIQIRMSGPGGIEKSISKPKVKKINVPKISKEKQKRYAKLPREEADTKVRRLSNKVIYEISLPGVTSLKDVFINQLESSIEIKAFSKDKAYFKLLPINLPIKRYKLQKQILTLELAS